MEFKSGKDEHEIILIDSDNSVLGKGYIYEFMESEILEKDKMNYFIYTEAEDEEMKRLVVNKLISLDKEQRKKYPHCDARVYNCCFSDNLEQIKFYSSIELFKHDEGMHLLTCDLNNIEINKVNNIEFEIKQDSLNSEEEIQDFINEHKKVFRSAPYTIDKIKELREEEGFKNIAIYDNNHIVGNILLFIEEAEIKYGLIEDLFISKEYRKHGLGQYLVIRAVEYFKGLGLHETRVEVWSSNHRAHQLYSKAGFAFKQELEASIGMAI